MFHQSSLLQYKSKEKKKISLVLRVCYHVRFVRIVKISLTFDVKNKMPGLLENNNTQFNESSFLYVYSISKSSYMYTRKSIDGGHCMKKYEEI